MRQKRLETTGAVDKALALQSVDLGWTPLSRLSEQ